MSIQKKDTRSPAGREGAPFFFVKAGRTPAQGFPDSRKTNYQGQAGENTDA